MTHKTYLILHDSCVLHFFCKTLTSPVIKVNPSFNEFEFVLLGNNKVQIYDSKTNEWSMGSRVRSPNGPIAASSHGGKIWVLGGETSELFKYDPHTDEWSQLAISLPCHIET